MSRKFKKLSLGGTITLIPLVTTLSRDAMQVDSPLIMTVSRDVSSNWLNIACPPIEKNKLNQILWKKDTLIGLMILNGNDTGFI